MNMHKIKLTMTAALISLCTAFGALAAEPSVVYEGSGSLVMPGAETVMDGSEQFGRITAPSVFENSYTGLSISIPQGYEAELGGETFYDPNGALALYGYVPDLLLSSYAAFTVDAPDPEMETDDTSVLMAYFLSKKGADGQDRDLNAYLEGVIGRLIRNDNLIPYIQKSDVQLGGETYLSYRLDYTEAIQQYYHTVFAKYAEHPAFDERFSFRAELYCRDLGDKYYVLMYVKNGERFERTADLTSYIF